MKTVRLMKLVEFVAGCRFPPTTRQVTDWWDAQDWADRRCLRSIQRDLRELVNVGWLESAPVDGVTCWRVRQKVSHLPAA